MLYTKSIPKKWDAEDIKQLLELKSQGLSNKEIAEKMDRTEVSIQIKLKRLSKKQNTYNKEHIEEKYSLNSAFCEEINPKTILDLYCGEKSFYRSAGYNALTNDINKDLEADYHEDAFRLICKLYYEKKKFDLVDLDPYGSAFDSFDIAIKMANKALIITLGELGHKRWKRLDYVSSHYDINSLEDFTIEKMIAHIQKIGLRNKKKLVIWQYREWRNIGRVYFIIEPIKITQQWGKKSS